MTSSRLDELDQISENSLLRQISAKLPRADASRNAHQEVDAELADVGLPEQLLAVTTDSVADEVASGLYKSPYEIGWVSVVASLSDLAAVGASPLGIVSSLCLAKTWSPEEHEGLLSGMADALRHHGTGTLGGDTNFGDQAAVTVTALGLVPRDRVLRRVGAQPGDLVFVSAPCGAGSLLALERLVLRSEPAAPYRPLARLGLGRASSPGTPRAASTPATGWSRRSTNCSAVAASALSATT